MKLAARLASLPRGQILPALIYSELIVAGQASGANCKALFCGSFQQHWESTWKNEIKRPLFTGPSQLALEVAAKLEHAGTTPKILSVGSGTGNDEFYFASLGCQVTATDLTQTSVEHLKSLSVNVAGSV